MKTLSAIFLILTFVFAAFSQSETNVYQIQQIYENADLNEKAINRFKEEIELSNDVDNDINEFKKLFTPIKGKYKVILFQSSSYGLGKGETKKIFHSILILKIDKNNEIIDGLDYLLEWAEVPFTSRFVRVSKKGVKLQKGLALKELEFRTFELNQPYNPRGIIDNLYNFREAF